MPVDFAMRMCLHQRPPVDQLLGMSSIKSYYTLSRPGTSSFQPHWARASRSTQPPVSPVSKFNYPGLDGTLRKKKKKRVVFADAKGLALTAVRFFTVDPPGSDSDDPPPTEKPDEEQVQSRMLQFQLGFPQPSADYPSFLKVLAESMVKLESCRLMGRLLIGKVRVCNMSPEKAVHIRITFNSWKNHQDIPCTAVHQNSEGSDAELFIFNVSFPFKLNPQDRVEFRVSCRSGSDDVLLWDDNGGLNYRILIKDVVQEEEVEDGSSVADPRYHSWPNRKSLLYSTITSRSMENIYKTLSRKENVIPSSSIHSQMLTIKKASVHQLG